MLLSLSEPNSGYMSKSIAKHESFFCKAPNKRRLITFVSLTPFSRECFYPIKLPVDSALPQSMVNDDGKD